MKKLILTAFIGLFVVSFAYADTAMAPETIPLTIKQKIMLTFNDSRMIPTLYCENYFNQYNKDGSPFVSKTNDVGVSQINIGWWTIALRKNLNIFFSEDDNLKMGKYIYDTQGITAWNAYQNDCYYKHQYLIDS